MSGAAAHFADYEHGEVAALLELSRLVLAWLKAEAEDPEDRSRRYARQRAVTDLLTLCGAIRRFHAPGRRKAAEAAAFKAQIGDAQRGAGGGMSRTARPASKPPARAAAPRATKPPLCPCGLEMFYDDEARRWLCRARFDGGQHHARSSSDGYRR